MKRSPFIMNMMRIDNNLSTAVYMFLHGDDMNRSGALGDCSECDREFRHSMLRTN